MTTVDTVLEPTFKEIGLEADPEVTAVPLIVTVVLAWLVVGVTVKLVTLFATLSVYEVVPEEKAELRVPELMERLLKEASLNEVGRHVVTTTQFVQSKEMLPSEAVVAEPANLPVVPFIDTPEKSIQPIADIFPLRWIMRWL